ncbi:hypothetical protein SAMN05444415_11558 [Salipiger profundus]|nr:hypothetical protein SAMN05444415_11558 [Salipiger profundus]
MTATRHTAPLAERRAAARAPGLSWQQGDRA